MVSRKPTSALCPLPPPAVDLGGLRGQCGESTGRRQGERERIECMDRFSNSLRRLPLKRCCLRRARPRMTAAAAASNRATTSGGGGGLASGGVRAFTLPCRSLAVLSVSAADRRGRGRGRTQGTPMGVPKRIGERAEERILPHENGRNADRIPTERGRGRKRRMESPMLEIGRLFYEIQFVWMKSYSLSFSEEYVSGHRVI